MDIALSFPDEIIFAGIAKPPEKKGGLYTLTLAVYPGEHESSTDREVIWTDNHVIHHFSKQYEHSTGEFWIENDSFLSRNKTLDNFNGCSVTTWENRPNSGDVLIVIWADGDGSAIKNAKFIDQAEFVLKSLRGAFIP